MTYFSTRRSIYARSIRRLLEYNIGWKFLAAGIARIVGYLPAKQLKFGSDNETLKSYRQCVHWVGHNPWVDSDDGFDYHQALQSITLPPTLYFTGANDFASAHPDDVERFRKECGPHESQCVVVAKAHGNLHDYGHIDILTHPDAPQDHFTTLLEWMKAHSMTTEKSP